jgi:hypothetical protein
MLSWSSGFTAQRTLRVVFGGLSSPRVRERRTDLYDAAVEVLPVLRDHPEELRRHARGIGAIPSARQRDADAIEVLDADRVAPRNHKQRGQYWRRKGRRLGVGPMALPPAEQLLGGGHHMFGLFPARADITPELRRSPVFALRKESGGDTDGKESKMSLRIEDG